MGEKEVLLQFKKFLVTLRFFWDYIFHFNLKVFNKLIRANNSAAEKACHGMMILITLLWRTAPN